MPQSSIGMILSILLFVTGWTNISAKFDQKDLIGKEVFVKHNLIFLDTAPEVYPGKIIFTKDTSFCGQSIWNFTIGRGSKVNIVKVEKVAGFMSIQVTAGEYGNYDILLSKSWRGNFEKSFREVFSFEPVEDVRDYCKPLTVNELIRCYGYPIYICEKNGKQIYYYNEGFVGRRINGFHDIWFEVEDGKVTDEHGYI